MERFGVTEYILLAVVMIPLLLAYFIPSIIAFTKNKDNKTTVLILNIFIGWSIIGWIVVLILALKQNPTSINEINLRS